MSIEYLVEGTPYVLSYPDLKEDFERYAAMTDDEFLNNLVPALHFVCVVCYFKQLPGYMLTSDEGLIHQMVHLLDGKTRRTALGRLAEIREMFAAVCRLA
ncbi:MAG: hypothetical protein ACJ741_06555 [Pyrinomonadaceae bacterium]